MRSCASLSPRGECLFHRWSERPLRVELPLDLGRKAARGALPPQEVERAILRRLHQPCRRILGHAVELPRLQRAAEGVLDDVFRQRQIVDSEHAGEDRDQPARLVPEEMLRYVLLRYVHQMPSCSTGRTSTHPPNSRIGHPEAIFAACSRSRASMREKPPITSFDSA